MKSYHFNASCANTNSKVDECLKFVNCVIVLEENVDFPEQGQFYGYSQYKHFSHP